MKPWPMLALLCLLAGCTSPQPTLTPAAASTPTRWVVTQIVTRQVTRDVYVAATPLIRFATPTPWPPRADCPAIPLATVAAREITATTPAPAVVPALLLVTQYFTYLDRGLHADAYALYAPAHQPDWEAFTRFHQQDYGQVCLYNVKPAPDGNLSQAGVQSIAAAYGLDDAHFQQFRVDLATYGANGSPWSVNGPAGELRSLYVRTAQQADGRWLILEIARYPWTAATATPAPTLESPGLGGHGRP